MWQRVQTLYFGLATLLVASLFWCDVAKIAGTDGIVEYVGYTQKPIYLVWIILLTTLQVLSLFGYRWRMKQFRVVVVTALMCLGFQGWLVVDYIANHDAMSYSWTALFPLVASVFDFIGARNILSDEALVQSVNRLRKSRKNRN